MTVCLEVIAAGLENAPLDDVKITSVAWNQQVLYVLAGMSMTGYTRISDLRGKCDIVALAYSGGSGTLAGQVTAMNSLAATKLKGTAEPLPSRSLVTLLGFLKADIIAHIVEAVEKLNVAKESLEEKFETEEDDKHTFHVTSIMIYLSNHGYAGTLLGNHSTLLAIAY
ncbi:hypothetical protein IW262DRAFT_1298006 [Armillaria fumosa]|nr:hypothetical protein IW262DRAFT_1298006 [Armillaria fumosa]